MQPSVHHARLRQRIWSHRSPVSLPYTASNYDRQQPIIAHRIRIEMVRVLHWIKNTEHATEFSLVWNA